MAKYNVLIVDDEKGMRSCLKSCITMFGYEVSTAENGKKALEIIENSQGIDAIITDINMPEMDGLSLIKEIYKKYSIPTLVMSADCSNQVKEAITYYAKEIAASKGIGDFDPFIEKPFKIEEIQEKLEQMVGYKN